MMWELIVCAGVFFSSQMTFANKPISFELSFRPVQMEKSEPTNLRAVYLQVGDNQPILVDGIDSQVHATYWLSRIRVGVETLLSSLPSAAFAELAYWPELREYATFKIADMLADINTVQNLAKSCASCTVQLDRPKKETQFAERLVFRFRLGGKGGKSTMPHVLAQVGSRDLKVLLEIEAREASTDIGLMDKLDKNFSKNLTALLNEQFSVSPLQAHSVSTKVWSYLSKKANHEIGIVRMFKEEMEFEIHPSLLVSNASN